MTELSLKNFKALQADKREMLKSNFEAPAVKECVRLNIIRIDKELAEFNQVLVSFLCGLECYEQPVFKIGNKYFDGSRPMTKANGYSLIKEL